MGFNKILDKIENKLEEYEENMDGEAPPWYGDKGHHTSSDTETKSSDQNQTRTSSGADGEFELVESEGEVQIMLELPGVPEDNIEIRADADTMYIDVEETDKTDERTYEYELPDDAEAGTIDASYENGLLEISISRS